MPIEILMPALSPTMKEGRLLQWMVAEGDAVSPGDILGEIETDKAVMEIEAIDEGVVGKLVVPAGTDGIEVNKVIAILLDEGESLKDIENMNNASGVKKEKSSESQNVAGSGVEKSAFQKDVSTAVCDTSSRGLTSDEVVRIPASPLAKRVAQEHGIALNNLPSGSGPGGRIVRDDVAKFIQNSGSAGLSGDLSDTIEVTHTSMRKAIARNLTLSKSTIPHFYLKMTCNIDALLELRSALNKQLATEVKSKEMKISVNDFFIKALACAYSAVPDANIAWKDDSTAIKNRSVHIGIAVSIPDGLVTPLVFDADRKGLKTIACEARNAIEKARKRELKPTDYQGGTSIVTNLGMYGVEEFSAIINPGHSSILSVGSGRKIPIVRDDAVVVGQVVTIVLSADHRVLDGLLAAQLLGAVKKYIEEPYLMLLT